MKTDASVMRLPKRVVIAALGLTGTMGWAAARAADELEEIKLEEIVITAQRVQSTVQKTPIAIQVVSGDQLVQAGIRDVKDLQRIVPGLTVQETIGGSSFFIRGVGTTNASSTTDSGLAISLDQMYFSRPLGPEMSLYDLERVEVLKGPQGTLYGRNATGGAINFISKKPQLNQFGGEASLEVGNYDAVKVIGAINFPVGDTLAFRLAAQENKHSGYMKDGYDDANTTAARLHMLWQPSDVQSILVTGEAMHNSQNGPGAVPRTNHQFITSDPREGGSSQAIRAYEISRATIANNQGLTPAKAASGRVTANPLNCLPGCVPAYLYPVDGGPYLNEKNGFVNVKVLSLRVDSETKFDFGTLTVLPAYLKTDADTLYFRSGSPIYTPSHNKQHSLEARLTSNQDQALTWIGGAFYLKEKQNFESYNAGTGGPPLLTYNRTPDVQTESKGVFAQGSYSLLDNLKATLGVRRSYEKKFSRNSSGGNLLPAAPPGPGPQPSFFSGVNVEAKSNANTYRAALEWQVAPTNLLYASYSTGFHGGGINNGAPAVLPICNFNGMTSAQIIAALTTCDMDAGFKPEKIRAYAIGSKNRFLNDRVQLNVEIYDWRYTEQQVSTLGVVNKLTTTLRTDNAGSSTFKGIEVESSWLITRDDRLTLNYNYNKSKYGQFTSYLVIYPNAANITVYTGRPFLRAPNTTGTFGYEHTFRMANGATLVPSVDGQYSSKVIFSFLDSLNPGQTMDDYQESYVKYNLNLAYNAPDDKWGVGLFVRNVADKTTVSNNTGQGATNTPWVNLAPPRTFGANFKAKF